MNSIRKIILLLAIVQSGSTNQLGTDLTTASTELITENNHSHSTVVDTVGESVVKYNVSKTNTVSPIVEISQNNSTDDTAARNLEAINITRHTTTASPSLRFTENQSTTASNREINYSSTLETTTILSSLGKGTNTTGDGSSVLLNRALTSSGNTSQLPNTTSAHIIPLQNANIDSGNHTAGGTENGANGKVSLFDDFITSVIKSTSINNKPLLEILKENELLVFSVCGVLALVLFRCFYISKGSVTGCLPKMFRKPKLTRVQENISLV